MCAFARFRNLCLSCRHSSVSRGSLLWRSLFRNTVASVQVTVSACLIVCSCVFRVAAVCESRCPSLHPTDSKFSVFFIFKSTASARFSVSSQFRVACRQGQPAMLSPLFVLHSHEAEAERNRQQEGLHMSQGRADGLKELASFAVFVLWFLLASCRVPFDCHQFSLATNQKS